MVSIPAHNSSREPERHHLWCQGARPDGEPCGSHAGVPTGSGGRRASPWGRGSDYCFWHDPDKEEERREELARREQLAGVPILSESMSLDTVADVEQLLRRVALYLATGGRIEPRRATAHIARSASVRTTLRGETGQCPPGQLV